MVRTPQLPAPPTAPTDAHIPARSAGRRRPGRATASQARRGHRRARAVIAVVFAMALLAGCAGSDGSSEATMDAAAPEPAPGAAGGAGEEAVADAGDGEAAVSSGDTDEAGGGTVEIAAQAEAALATAPTDRIVREGTVRLEVEEGTFDRSYSRVVAAATRLGGTVLSSDATADDEGLAAGSVTVRVPADNFDRLLTSVAEIGKVRQRQISSQDVSDEFVDLEARLRHHEAQERFYLSLLADAQGVEDAIAVQQQVDDIQQAIEQIKGRLRYLEERTSFSRLTIELSETGAPFQGSGSERPTFAHYVQTARDALVTVLGGALVLATVALPFVLVGVVVLIVVRRFLPTARRTQPAAPDA